MKLNIVHLLCVLQSYSCMVQYWLLKYHKLGFFSLFVHITSCYYYVMLDCTVFFPVNTCHIFCSVCDHHLASQAFIHTLLSCFLAHAPLSEHAPLLEYIGERKLTVIYIYIYNIGAPAFSINSQSTFFLLYAHAPKIAIIWYTVTCISSHLGETICAPM